MIQSGVVMIAVFLISVLPFLTAIDEFYLPTENLVVNCGSSDEGTDDDGRIWKGDIGSKFAPFADTTTLVGKALNQASSVSNVPYMTARIFQQQEYTYTFPMTAGRKFIRLYFYPSDYKTEGDTITSDDDALNVTTGDYTLLYNFSASQTARALNYDHVRLEYSVNLDANSTPGYLNLTFKPFTPTSYAFINGIEIVSMPEDIFAKPSKPPLMVGLNIPFTVQPNMALQTVQRLNAGGNMISPKNDSGLYRLWNDDSYFISGMAMGVAIIKDAQVNITSDGNNGIMALAAPQNVYGTARSMGPTKEVNINYNLTWNLPVDAGFRYLIRLHFCEIQHPMTKVNMRVFDIYINNQTAKMAVDVIAMTGEIGVSTFLDFVISIPDVDGPGLSQTISIALHPNTDAKPEYYDSILNGLEIFKMNQPGGNLAGPRLAFLEKSPEGQTDSKKESGKSVAMVVGLVVGVLGFLVLSTIVCCFLLYRRRSSSGSGSTTPFLLCNMNSTQVNRSRAKAQDHSSTSSSISLQLMQQGSASHHFSFAEIEEATEMFDKKLLLGVGGFGNVYRGHIKGGEESKLTAVAIKRSNPSSDQGIHEFKTEIEMLSQLRHHHLVSLIGYCEERGEMILVYDYMSNGTLREHLYKTKNKPLSWTQRLQICIGSARGLHYLHTGAKDSIIHRDVKTTNILLDDKWVAKVSDFGLSKTGPSLENTHVSTFAKGSFGYMDPEYFRRQQLSDKSDVYSFGVVLFEVLCARQPLLPPGPTIAREQVPMKSRRFIYFISIYFK